MREKGMSLIVKTITKWIKGFIFLFGVYITLTGHISPGGGFAGGVIVSCAFILLALAFGKEYAFGRLDKETSHFLDCSGALMFAVLGSLGIFFGGVFFLNFLQKMFPGLPFKLFSAGIIPLCNVAIGIKVGASLFLVFMVLSVLHVISKEDERILHRRKVKRTEE